TPDGGIILVGQEVVDASVLKVDLNPAMFILGNTYVTAGNVQTFQLDVPAGWGYNYIWTYKGNYSFFFPDSIGKTVAIFFSDTATSGKLICVALYGITVVSYSEVYITVNTTPTDANLLAPLVCSLERTSCDYNYIQSFKLHNLVSDSSKCDVGYTDFTESGLVDTLILGGVYSATLSVPFKPGNINYVAIWLDYNNDGAFNTGDEFVTGAVSPDTIIEVKNIMFKNEKGYEGPKRLRVRCQPDSSFSPTESCQNPNDFGETEDYLIILKAQDQVEAPQIITPNDDGKNDYFVVRGIDPTASNRLTIFDRLGNVIFSAKNYENNWNGKTDKGENLVPGTYYYVFTSNEESIRGFLEIRY
ncbi:MAG: gliding motility-associated C-terminal domain-containing protein, partial [Cytophagaceae bacterium]|nr:gliding motility-associated C-terminal domain-containing protein [Cytophagaceae bacterium]